MSIVPFFVILSTKTRSGGKSLVNPAFVLLFAMIVFLVMVVVLCSIFYFFEVSGCGKNGFKQPKTENNLETPMGVEPT